MATRIWRLYDGKKHIFINNVSDQDLFNVIESIPASERNVWQICGDDDSGWSPLLDRLNKIVGHTDPSGVLKLSDYVDALAEDTKTSDRRKKKRIEQRKLRRFSKKLDVFIDVGEEILSGSTKDISLTSIKLDKKFPIRYSGKYYPLVLKAKPTITLRCTPRITEKEAVRNAWNIVTIDPNFNLSMLAKFLGE